MGLDNLRPPNRPAHADDDPPVGGGTSLREGTITRSVASLTEEVFVTDEDSQTMLGPCMWMPRVDLSGQTVLPNVGDLAVVAITDEGEPWVVAYYSEAAGESGPATVTQSELDAVIASIAAHLADTVDAHPGSAVTNTPAGNLVATTVQAAINELDTEKQPVDADLTTIAALDSGMSTGVMATEAAGWVKRTYAQVKTSLGLVKGDVGLGNVDNTSDADKPVSTAQATANTTDRARANHTGTQAATTVTVADAAGNLVATEAEAALAELAAVFAGSYNASMYLANSGAPTHTSNGGWQKVADGGGTDTWTAEWDKRPSGVAAQVDTATNKRIDIKKTGVYWVSISNSMAALSDGKTHRVAAYKNGAQVLLSGQTLGAATGSYIGASGPVLCTSGEYLELWAYQNDSVSELYDVSASYVNRLTATYMGPST